MNYSFRKTFIFSILVLATILIFTLADESHAQNFFNHRSAFRQQQIEKRVRQISPQNNPKPDSQSAPTVKKTPASVPEKKSEKAPAVEKKADKASVLKEKTEKIPAKEEKNTPEIKNEHSDDSAVLPAEETLQEEALEKVLADPNIPEEAKPVLKQATKEEIQKSVEEATAEMEVDAKNEHIDGVVETSLKEVDEESIESAVEEVMDSSDEILKEDLKRSGNIQEDGDESLPESVNQVIEEARTVTETTEKEAEETPAEVKKAEETPAEVEKAEETPAEVEKEEETPAEVEKEEETPAEVEKEEETPAEVEKEEETPAEVEKEEETPAEVEKEEETPAEVEKEEETPAEVEKEEETPVEVEKANNSETKLENIEQPAAKMVKMEDLDKELQVPENASFDDLQVFLTSLDSIRPADLDQTNQEVLTEQVKTFFQKLFQAKLNAANQMLALEELTEEQWKEAVSWKVQCLANLFRVDETKVAEMRDFVEEISVKAPKDVLWTVESILIEMELAQIKEEPKPEELKAHVTRMLEHTKKGIEEKCVRLDFVLTTVQMVALTEDALSQEESKVIFESAIAILNTSEMNQLKEMAKFLQKILDQREIVGKTPDLTLETYDGKTIKTADFLGKTLLIYCFQMSSKEQLQDLGLVYQIYMAYHSRGLEIIGIVPEEKTDEMKELLDQIPWPMVFNGKDVIEKLSVPTLPAKIRVNTEGKIESTNVGPLDLMKYLEAKYGPALKNTEEKSAEKVENPEKQETEAEEVMEETKALDPPAENEEETKALDPPAENEEETKALDPPAENEEETKALDPPAENEEEISDVKNRKKPEEKAEKKVEELDLNLEL